MLPILPPSLLPSLAQSLRVCCVPGSALCTGAQRYIRQWHLLPEEDLGSYCTPSKFPDIISKPGHKPFPRQENCGDALALAILGFELAFSGEEVFEESQAISSSILTSGGQVRLRSQRSLPPPATLPLLPLRPQCSSRAVEFCPHSGKSPLLGTVTQES